MNAAVVLLVLIIALLHVGFLILEMVFWSKPLGLKIFRQSEESARASSALAANQGLYNGFLAAGLFWSVFHQTPEISMQLRYFFLICVLIAGLYGAYSVNKRIFFIQALPALIALLLTALTYTSFS